MRSAVQMVLALILSLSLSEDYSTMLGCGSKSFSPSVSEKVGTVVAEDSALAKNTASETSSRDSPDVEDDRKTGVVAAAAHGFFLSLSGSRLPDRFGEVKSFILQDPFREC